MHIPSPLCTSWLPFDCEVDVISRSFIFTINITAKSECYTGPIERSLILYIYIFIAIALDESIFLDVLHLRNEFNFSGVHGAMNRSGSRAK